MARLGITLGDPDGIGPEVALKAILQTQVHLAHQVIIFGPQSLTTNPQFHVLVSQLSPQFLLPSGHVSGCFWVDCSDATAGLTAYLAIKTATDWALSGKLEAICTAPISKTALKAAHCPAFDHTTILAQLTKAPSVRMAFYSPTLKTVLHSVHIPFSKVISTLTSDSLFETIRHSFDYAKKLKIQSPKIAISGLNPHAGEGGLMGPEEGAILSPVIDLWNEAFPDCPVVGPFPPDTLYHRAHSGEFDLVISLYHDQGLIPIKLLYFDTAVNITLGLPFIRTSPDHGTAFDIAYQNKANSTSMAEAILLSLKMVP